MINPLQEVKDSQLDNDTINLLNPVYSLINWENGYMLFLSFDNKKDQKFVNNNDHRNGLISFSEDSEFELPE